MGRDAEIGRLRVAVDDLAAGRGQVLLLVGEAGIGKTRLLEELRAVVGERAVWLEGQCLSYGGLPAWPFEEMLRGWLAVGEAEPEIAARTRARARLGALLGPRLGEVLRRSAACSTSTSIRSGSRTPSGRTRRRPSRRAFCDWIETLAGTRPVVVAVEDMHWASPQARELGEALLELTDRAAVMVVATLRADSASEAWGFRLRALGSFAHRTLEIALGPLDDGAAAELVRALAGEQIDEATVAWAVARAEGNPLYLEELVRILLEDTAVERRRTWTLTVGQVTLPARDSRTCSSRGWTRCPRGRAGSPRYAAVIGRRSGRRAEACRGETAESTNSAGELLALVRAGIVQELRGPGARQRVRPRPPPREAALSTLTVARHRELTCRSPTCSRSFLASAHRTRPSGSRSTTPQQQARPRGRLLEQAAAACLADPPHAVELLEAAARAAAKQGDVESERRIEARIAELWAGA